jgi:hypothetical protein
VHDWSKADADVPQPHFTINKTRNAEWRVEIEGVEGNVVNPCTNAGSTNAFLVGEDAKRAEVDAAEQAAWDKHNAEELAACAADAAAAAGEGGAGGAGGAGVLAAAADPAGEGEAVAAGSAGGAGAAVGEEVVETKEEPASSTFVTGSVADMAAAEVVAAPAEPMADTNHIMEWRKEWEASLAAKNDEWMTQSAARRQEAAEFFEQFKNERETNVGETGKTKRETERQTVEAIDGVNAEGGWLKVASFVDFNAAGSAGKKVGGHGAAKGGKVGGAGGADGAPAVDASDVAVYKRLLIELKVWHFAGALGGKRWAETEGNTKKSGG